MTLCGREGYGRRRGTIEVGGANIPDDQGQGGVAAGLIKSKVKYNFLTGGEWGLLGDKINFQGCQTSAVREAILQKIPEFHEIFFLKW